MSSLHHKTLLFFNIHRSIKKTNKYIFAIFSLLSHALRVIMQISIRFIEYYKYEVDEVDIIVQDL